MGSRLGSVRVRRTILAAPLFVAMAAAPGAGVIAQEIQLGDSGPGAARQRQHVELETETATAKAGQPDWIELRFRIDPGLHINSHTPKDELLVPTALAVDPADQVKVVTQEYPAGIPLRLEIGGGETLSTYQGEFRVRLQVVAGKGSRVLAGTLHYQACDARSCFPPKNLPVRLALDAR